MSILLKVSLLIPADESLRVRLSPFAKELDAILNTPGDPRTMDAYQSAFTALSLGMMACRSGDFVGASEWSRRCLAYPDENQARAATAHAIFSLAARKLGHGPEADAGMARAREIFSGSFAQDIYPRGRGNGYWMDWAIARVWLKEAETAEISETRTRR